MNLTTVVDTALVVNETSKMAKLLTSNINLVIYFHYRSYGQPVVYFGARHITFQPKLKFEAWHFQPVLL